MAKYRPEPKTITDKQKFERWMLCLLFSGILVAILVQIWHSAQPNVSDVSDVSPYVLDTGDANPSSSNAAVEAAGRAPNGK